MGFIENVKIGKVTKIISGSKISTKRSYNNKPHNLGTHRFS